MVTYAYTGSLKDIGLGSIAGWRPVLTVRPVVSAYGPDGLISDVRVPITLAADDTFTVQLVASADLRPATGGQLGVDYEIELSRFGLADDLQKVWNGTEVWRFTAKIGGGNIADMQGGPLFGIYVGPPWPAAPYPPGLYLDTVTGDGTIVD